LVGVVGYEPFLRGMRHYSEQWRFRHPYAQDFFDSFCEGAGVDVHWYFEDLFRGTGTVDWSIDVQQQRESERKGVFQAGPRTSSSRSTRRRRRRRRPSRSRGRTRAGRRAEAERGQHDEDSPWKARVLVVRHGDLRLPLTIELRYDDKSTERRTWSREDQAATHWLSIEVSGKKKLVAVVIDPERTYFIDTDMSKQQLVRRDRSRRALALDRAHFRALRARFALAGGARRMNVLLQANEIDTTADPALRAGCSCTRCA